SQPWVKTSLAPGSKAVTEYLVQAGVMRPLEQLGFFLVGYGCTTCIGNSGPLPPPISQAIADQSLVVCSVLSGNRNFEGRVHPQWNAIAVPGGDLFAWDAKSTYVKHPPYFENMPAKPAPLADIKGARVLAVLGDSITTDHISPAGSIKKDSPAGKYLIEHGVPP